MKIVSACLAGINCRYDGKSNANEQIIEMVRKGEAILVCPEQLGGFGTPRPGSEIVGGTGEDVLDSKARVLQNDGTDVTKEFIRGAEETLKIAKLSNCKEAILKSRSPSCGCGRIYNGCFSKQLISGDGVTTSLLKKNGINVITEEEL